MTTYADVEDLLIIWLPGALNPTARVSDRTPADPGATYSWLPFIRVQRVGGRREQGIDRPRIVLEYFTADKDSMADLTSRTCALFDGPIFHLRSPAGIITSAQTDSAPSWVPYDDVNVTKFQSMHSLVVQSLK